MVKSGFQSPWCDAEPEDDGTPHPVGFMLELVVSSPTLAFSGLFHLMCDARICVGFRISLVGS